MVSLAAPGTKITSLNPASSKTLTNALIDKQGNRAEIEGTILAAPYVAGAAALVRERFPALTARQVMNRIITTASHPAATGERDNLVGHGMINPLGALTAIIPAEQGIPPDQPINLDLDLPPPLPQQDSTPAVVALIGSTAGIGALLLTFFTTHTIRRSRQNKTTHPQPLPKHGR
jgi:membrane-anchored mycosin MYCP